MLVGVARCVEADELLVYSRQTPSPLHTLLYDGVDDENA